MCQATWTLVNFQVSKIGVLNGTVVSYWNEPVHVLGPTRDILFPWPHYPKTSRFSEHLVGKTALVQCCGGSWWSLGFFCVVGPRMAESLDSSTCFLFLWLVAAFFCDCCGADAAEGSFSGCYCDQLHQFPQIQYWRGWFLYSLLLVNRFASVTKNIFHISLKTLILYAC